MILIGASRCYRSTSSNDKIIVPVFVGIASCNIKIKVYFADKTISG